MEEIFIHIKDDFFPAIVFSMFFVWALVMWVREGDNDEQLQNQIDGKERVMKIGDEVYVHGYVDEIRNDCIIIRNEGGYFGTITSEITADRKTEPQTDCKMPYEDCEDCETHLKAQYGYCNKCKWYGDKQVCGRCRNRNLYAPKDEPQTIRCPKCGRSDYIREFGKDFSVTAEEAGFKYKCINCNTYIEPQSDRKTEPQINNFFREPTAEERKAVAEYIESISIPTGVNMFDFMDEPQSDLIKRGDAIEAIEVVDWYHQNRNKDMVSGANSDEHQAWYKADDIYKALEAVPSVDKSHTERSK